MTTKREMKFNPYPTPFTEINSRSTKDLNIRPEAVKLLQKMSGKKLLSISLGNNFCGYDTKGTSHMSRSEQVGLHQTKASAQQRKPATK